MKKVIDGKTYNTETAILIAEGSSFSTALSWWEFGVYKTRKGVVFLLETNFGENYRGQYTHSYRWHVLGEAGQISPTFKLDSEVPFDSSYSPRTAGKLIEEYCSLDEYETVFGMTEEA